MAGQSEPLSRGWAWDQAWLDVLFLHWRMAPETLRPQVPRRLHLDTYQDSAWVSLVLFRMHVRRRWLPFVPGLSSLLEVNLRTYVRSDGRPGIWFLSAHADNSWAIRAARLLTPMPYCQAAMRYRQRASGFEFAVQRPALALAFQPLASPAPSRADTLDAWLLERYRLFALDRCQRWREACVDHPPWATQPVELSLSANAMGDAFDLDLAQPPDRVAFSPGVRVRFGPFAMLDAKSSSAANRERQRLKYSGR